MKKIFTSDSYWNVYSTACVITVQAFTFSLEHMLVSFIKHRILISLWLWLFILLPKTSVTQLSVYPTLLGCLTHGILLRKSIAYVCHTTALQRMVR